jgi:hypothetical protein
MGQEAWANTYLEIVQKISTLLQKFTHSVKERGGFRQMKNL